MPQKRKRQAGTSSKMTRTAAKNTKRFKPKISHRDILRKIVRRAPHWTQLTSVQQERRRDGVELLRLRRQGLTWKDAEQQSGVSRRIAEPFFPRAFFRDERRQLQVRQYDPYTRHLNIATNKPGEFEVVHARGNRQASLVGTWNNAVRSAGGGDFSLIDAFPRNVSIGGIRLPTSHKAVSRIAAAAAEGKNPFEDIYALAGTR